MDKIQPGSIIYNMNPPFKIVGEMSLRDYFAASFVSSGHVFKSISAGNTPELEAEQAYILADAMLKARMEKNGG